MSDSWMEYATTVRFNQMGTPEERHKGPSWKHRGSEKWTREYERKVSMIVLHCKRCDNVKIKSVVFYYKHTQI